MKKLLSVLLLVLCLSFGGLVACDASDDGGGNDPAPTTYTVAFTVDGDRYATKKVNAGGTISGTVADPTKDGYTFDYWTLNDVEIDIYTYVVNSNVNFVAHFTAIPVDVFNVFIQVNSNLTQAEAEAFRDNFLATLTTDEAAMTTFNILAVDAVGLRAALDAASDKDVIIGGNTPVSEYDAHTDGPITNVASGHFASSNRKIIICSNTDDLELATRLYAFASIPYVKPVNLTVIVHGDTDETTVLTDSETVIVMPEITVGDNELFKGFTTVENGSIAIVCAIDAELKYDDIKTLVEEAATTLNLYPVIEEKPVEPTKLNVYIQVNGNYLTQDEAEAFRDAFLATLSTEEKNEVEFFIQSANATNFKNYVNGASVENAADVIVGGNSPLKDFNFDDNYTTKDDSDNLSSTVVSGQFASTNRKVIIVSGTDNSELAVKLFNFATTAPSE